jgi:hypothetical protein
VRLSRTVSLKLSLLFNKNLTRVDPTYPAPPVIKIFTICIRKFILKITNISTNMQNQDIISIKNTINNDGFFEIKNFYTENNLKILRNFVDEKLQENKNQYFFLT